MVIRIRWQSVEPAEWSRVALAIGSLFAPLALLAFSVAFWAFAAEARWTNGFPIQVIMFSHWQVWLAIAALLMVVRQIVEGIGMPNDRRLRAGVYASTIVKDSGTRESS